MAPNTAYRYKPITEGSDLHHQDTESDDDITAYQSPSTLTRNQRWCKRIATCSHVIAWILVAILSFTTVRTHYWGWNRFRQHKLFPAQLTYSPAQEAIEYKVAVFEQAFEKFGNLAPEFRGPPSDALDEAWSNLYNFGMSAIPKQQATYLTNKTSPIPDLPGQYVIQLDVFHQLHCLNRIRKALNPHYFCPRTDPHCDDHRAMSVNYDPADDVSDHLSHCLHSIRQSIMCSADIAPVVWHESEGTDAQGRHINQGFLSVAHTCRDFERIKEWAVERQMHAGLNVSVVPEEDGIVIPTFP